MHCSIYHHSKLHALIKLYFTTTRYMPGCRVNITSYSTAR